jgi:hypothetical protein
MNDNEPNLFGELPGPTQVAVTLTIGWTDLFDKEMSDAQRRNRWAKWIRLKKAKHGNYDAAKYWSDSEGCHDERGVCKHLRGGWCVASSLPAGVNPYLTFRHSLLGMACMGIGFELKAGGIGR